MELVVGAWPSRREFKEQAKVIAITAWFAQSILDNPSEFSAEANSNQNPSSTKLTSKKLHRFETLIGRELVLDLGNRLKIIGVFVPPEGDQMFTNERQRILRARGIVPIGGVLVYATGTQLKFAARMGQVDSAQEQLKAYAIRKYGDAIDVLSSGNQIRVALSTSRNAASIMTFFAAGGLMIAALNITNLMLARVLGRTRGIGLSVALGSSQTLIFGLFLAEALALGLIGGLLGVVLAQGFTFGLSAALQSSKDFSYTGFDFSLRPTYFIIGIVISLCISVFFGGYPAWVASRISPSEALRV